MSDDFLHLPPSEALPPAPDIPLPPAKLGKTTKLTGLGGDGKRVGDENDGGGNDSDLDNMSIDAAMMAVEIKRAGILTQQLTDIVNEVKTRNQQIFDYNNMITQLQKFEPEGTDDTTGGSIPPDLHDELVKAGCNLDVGSWGGDGRWDMTKAKFEIAITSMKDIVTSLNSDQETAMVKLQDLTNKHNDAMDALSSFLQAGQKLADDIQSRTGH